MQRRATHAVQEEFGAMIDKPRDQVGHVTRQAT